MKKILLLILIIPSQILWAQSRQGKLSGTVSNEEGTALPGITIFIKETSQGTATDVDGKFTIENLVSGSYTLIFSGVGFNPSQKKISLSAGETFVLNHTMKEQVSQLQAVEIIGRKEDGYKNTASFIGSKTETNIKDLPQSVSYATKELIADQGIMRVGETVKNFSGVNQFTFYDDITIRGFRINGGSNTQLVNGMRTTTGFWKQPLVNFLERVEVLKGPSSVLFGNASPGGVVNRVTKKPLDISRNSLSFSLGSFNNIRALADFTGPVNESKTLLYRLNLGYEDAQSFRDLQFDKNLIVAPSFSFLPSDKTRVNLDVVYNSSKSRLDRGQSAFSDNLYSTPISLSLNTANDFLNEQTYTVTTSLNHQFTPNISFNASYMKTGYNEDLSEHRSSNAYAVDGNGDRIDNLIARQVFIRKRTRYVDNVNTFFHIKAQTGHAHHKIVAGYDYAREFMPPGGSQLTANGYRNADNTGSINNFNPANIQNYLLDRNGNPVPNVSHYDLTNSVASQKMQDMSKYYYASTSYDPTLYHLNAVYLQDQITIGRLQAMLGLRYEMYSDFIDYRKETEQEVKQEVLLPRIGLVFTVNDNINLFGTYVEGYNPQTAAAIANPNAGGPFDPLISDMYEVGMKSDWFGKRLELSTSVYQITQKNTLYPVVGEQDLLQQIGKEIARGYEIDLTGRLLPTWSVMASYAYNDAHITASPNENDLGRQKPNAPKHQGNLWTKFEIGRGFLEGFGLGLGSNFVAERNVSLNVEQQIPGYVLFNSAIYYTSGNMKLQLNYNNMGNKTHWVGGYDFIRLFPGAPRNFLGTITYSF